MNLMETRTWKSKVESCSILSVANCFIEARIIPRKSDGFAACTWTISLLSESEPMTISRNRGACI